MGLPKACKDCSRCAYLRGGHVCQEEGVDPYRSINPETAPPWWCQLRTSPRPKVLQRPDRCDMCPYFQHEGSDPPAVKPLCKHKDEKGNFDGPPGYIGGGKPPDTCPVPAPVWLPPGREKSPFKVMIISRCADCGWCRESPTGTPRCAHPDVIQMHKEAAKDWKPSPSGPSLCEILGNVDPEKEIYAGCPLTDLNKVVEDGKDW